MDRIRIGDKVRGPFSDTTYEILDIDLNRPAYEQIYYSWCGEYGLRKEWWGSYNGLLDDISNGSVILVERGVEIKPLKMLKKLKLI